MEIKVPPLMSSEGRANMIADEIARAEHAGDMKRRRAHVIAHAMAHIRAAVLQAAQVTGEDNG